MTATRTSLRAPAVAGLFYPRSADTLSRTVAELLRAGEEPQLADACGIVAPHAGYPYSGGVAGRAFAAVRGRKARIGRALILGPAHFVAFRGLAAPSCDAFATPLGAMPVDRAAVAALAKEGLVAIDDEPHAPEHAIEVELPFLQALFDDLPIVPILVGTAAAEAVAAVVARLWSADTLLIVSSDLSHYEDYERAQSHDGRTAAAIESLCAESIGPADACGHLAVRGALIEARRRRLCVARLDLRNSGDTAGDRRSVVGYGAWAFLAPTAGAG